MIDDDNGARGADSMDATAPGGQIDPVQGRDVIGGGATAPTHDTEHEAGLSDLDARVAGDAAPLNAASVTVDDPKDPLGSLPDTATTAETVSQPLTINTDVSDRAPPTLSDAVIPTKPGGADLEDVLDDKTKDVVSRAPARGHEGLINELDLKWAELKHFASTIAGDIEGELGAVLKLVREHL